MSADAGHPAPDDRTPRPGPSAWVFIGAGWIVIGWVVAGVLREAERTHPGSWATWVVGAALVHDLVLLPLVLAVGWVLARAVPAAWRSPVRSGLVVVAVVVAVTWPVVRRFGARTDNPSLLPLPYGRNLLVVVGLVAVAVAVGGGVAAVRGRHRHRGVGP